MVIKTIRLMGFQGGMRPGPMIPMVLGLGPQAKGVGIIGRIVGSEPKAQLGLGSGCRTFMFIMF